MKPISQSLTEFRAFFWIGFRGIAHILPRTLCFLSIVTLMLFHGPTLHIIFSPDKSAIKSFPFKDAFDFLLCAQHYASWRELFNASHLDYFQCIVNLHLQLAVRPHPIECFPIGGYHVQWLNEFHTFLSLKAQRPPKSPCPKWLWLARQIWLLPRAIFHKVTMLLLCGVGV